MRSIRTINRLLKGSLFRPYSLRNNTMLPCYRSYSSLHWAAEYGTPTQVKITLQNFKSKIFRAAQTVSDINGKLPIEIAIHNPNNIPDRSIERILLPYSLPRQFRYLSEKVKVEPIVFENDIHRKIVKEAEKAANKARETIQFSSTHPSINKLSLPEFKMLDRRIAELRAPYAWINNATLFHTAAVATTIEFQMGNCQEFAHLVVEFLMKNNGKIPLDIFSIRGGDHVFSAANRKKDCNPKKPSDWNKDTVISDASNGFVCSPASLFKNLRVHTSYIGDNSIQNLLPFYNPNFHELEVLYRFEPTSQGKYIITGPQKCQVDSDDEGLEAIQFAMRRKNI